jgi:thioredoxin 1
MANVGAVRDETFEAEVLKSDKPVLVDFTATWCGPCQALAPTLEAAAAEYADRVKVVKCDVDQARATAMRFRVASVPTLLMFSNGEVVGQLVGNRPKSDVTGLMDQALGQ